ncbi:MAG: ornithine carbamoyltransferase [Opitutales bacterium]|nr:ornithine carbamoyltransferase [Opitutales bacterium]
MRHFLKETDFSHDEAAAVFQNAANLKAQRGKLGRGTLDGQTWGLLFAKSSTRTRVSFEVGIHELGAHPMYLDQRTTQIGRGETISDTARVLSRYIHGLVIRTYGHEIVEEFAQFATVPVVNALTDFLHPCQIYTDAFTLAERWAKPGQRLIDSLKGKKLAYIGDCSNNMANSWILGGAMFGMKIALSGPAGYGPGVEIRKQLANDGLEDNFLFTTDPLEAAADADVLYTDVWVSMGQEAEEAERLTNFKPYTIDAKLMAAAKKDALFMHCLPAHIGMEVSQEVYESPASIIFDQAENRLHVQKAIVSALV